MDEQKKSAAPLLLGAVAVILGLTMAPIFGIMILFGGVLGGDSLGSRCRR